MLLEPIVIHSIPFLIPGLLEEVWRSVIVILTFNSQLLDGCLALIVPNSRATPDAANMVTISNISLNFIIG